MKFIESLRSSDGEGLCFACMQRPLMLFPCSQTLTNFVPTDIRSITLLSHQKLGHHGGQILKKKTVWQQDSKVWSHRNTLPSMMEQPQ